MNLDPFSNTIGNHNKTLKRIKTSLYANYVVEEQKHHSGGGTSDD